VTVLKVIISLLVIMTVLGCATEKSVQVSIHEQNFDLRDIHEQVDFLREMYNLATHVAALSRELDPAKKEYLHAIYKAASKLKSFSTKSQTKTMGNTTIHSITEESTRTRGSQDKDDLGVFEAEDIQNVLRQMHYEIKFIVYGVRVPVVFSGFCANACSSILALP
jgi:hypothetical protein